MTITTVLTLASAGLSKALKTELIIGLICLMSVAVQAQTGRFVSAEQFRQQAFPETEPVSQVLWVDKSLRSQAENILGHGFYGLRTRYWEQGQRSAWILDEVGKERPITIGVVIDAGRIVDVMVLEFRESRGGEVRHRFFTRQFADLKLMENGRGHSLSGSIDGITGATLSVRAVKKVATLALLFHHHIQKNKNTD